MKLTKLKPDYSERDLQGKVAFYVLLWKRKDVDRKTFFDYWRNVHGPVCARLPGQHQYWQFHLDHNPSTLWSKIEGINYETVPEDQFDGIAELTFASEQQRQRWFEAASILMDDEHNLFRKAIGYNTSANNSQTYVDRISDSEPNGTLGLLKFHVMIRKAPSVRLEEFRSYMRESFAPVATASDAVLKFRLHLFEEVDNSRADATGTIHTEPLEKQYQAAFEIAFANSLEKKRFFASKEYQQTVSDQPWYISQMSVFPERAVHTFVYDGQMTLSGQRSSTVARLISQVGAINQLQNDVVSLMLKQNTDSTQMNGSTNGSQKKKQTTKRKRTNYYKDLVADYSRPQPILSSLAKKLIDNAEKIVAMKEDTLPSIDTNYTLEQIEAENREWWPTHCEALRQGRGDILTGEYRENLVYLCQDGPYHGLEQQKEREKHWWAIIAQPGVTMCWPIVMFYGEIVYFEWKCVDDETYETTAKGTVTWIRRGHRGACYLKTEQLTFYRDVFAPSDLLNLIATA